MPGILAEKSIQGLPEGKGGGEGERDRDCEEETGIKNSGQSGDVAEDNNSMNQMLKKALEELTLYKSSEQGTEEEEQTARLSSPDSANLSLSTCSTSEVEGEKAGSSMDISQKKEAAEDSTEEKKKEGEEGAEGEGSKEPSSSLGEAGFITVHLKMPGVPQPVDVMLTSRDTVHDLLQYALERPECCYRTSLSVRHKGKRLDDFLEIGMLKELRDGDIVELLEEPYTQRDVRTHVQRLKDLLSTNPLHQAMTCSDGLTLSFLAAITVNDPEEGASRLGDDLTDPTKLEPPSFIMPQLKSCDPADPNAPSPAAKLPPLTPFYPPDLSKQFKFPECLKSLGYSLWNPPPSIRKMKGDLAYLEVTTLEGQVHYITATPSGFYLNRSTSQENFDPTPKKTHHHNRHLVGLLSQISPLFKKNFAQLQKFGEHRHAFEVLPVPYPTVPWLVPKPEHKPPTFRIDDSLGLRAIPDEMVVGQVRDWNEELQTARELPSTTPAAKVFRERTLFKIHTDFVQASTRGAMAAVDGMLTPLNPGDEPKYRMYLWNNIFFSLAFDGRDHYKEFGGDEAAHAAAGADLQGVAAYERLERKDLYTLGTVLVDYRGFRVVCQTIIPGLLQKEQDSAVVYGSVDTGKTVITHNKFEELLRKMANDFHIKEHKILTEKDEEVTLPLSFEVKGIVGNDSRHYALDLFRIFPPDANFLVRPEGVRIRHKLCVLRPEMIDTFLSYKFMLFLKLVREKTCNLKIAQGMEKKEKEGASSKSESKATVEDDSPPQSSSLEEASVNTPATQTSSEAKEEKEEEDKVTTTRQAEESSSEERSTTAMREEENKSEKGESAAPSSDKTGRSSSSSKLVFSSSSPSRPLPPTTTLSRATNIAAMSASLITGPSGLIGTQNLNQQVSPHPQLPPQPQGEDSELQMSSNVLSLETPSIAEKKEVGPEIPGSEEEELPSKLSMLKGSVQLDKELNTSELEDNPEIAAIIKEAAVAAGSTSTEEYTIKFNVDILAPGVRHADSEDELKKDRQLVHEAATFLLENVAPRYVRDCIQLTVTPTDGESLKASLHSRGINVRYLGYIAQIAAKREDLRHLMHLCISEMVVRVAKKSFRKLLRDTPVELTSEAVAHFLNCFLSVSPFPEGTKEEPSVQNGHPRKNKKKKGTRRQKVAAHLKITSVTLWAEIKEEVDWYYRHVLNYSSVSDMCSQTKLHQLALLRELCKKTGIQLLCREYDFTAQPVFTEEDVIALVPVVKHTDFRPVDPIAVFELAQTKFTQGDFKSAFELFEDAVQMFIQIYGPLHSDIANCYRHLARLSYITANNLNALSFQYKATLVFERVLGVDHHETLSAYVNLALYCHNTNQTAAALRLLYRARYILLLMYGEDHPEMATIDSNIAVILHTVKDFKNSLHFLESTKIIHEKYHGTFSVQTALTHHLIARVQSFLGDFRTALQHEKATFSIYQKKYGEGHERTKESSQCLSVLTEKAVTMQKKINEMTGKGGARLLVDLPGSWGDVVGMVSGQDSRPAAQRSRPHIIRKRKKYSKQQQQASTTE